MTARTTAEKTMTDWLASQREAMIELLAEVVNTDSGSYDKTGVDAVGARFKRFFAEHAMPVTTEAHETYGEAIHASLAKHFGNRVPEIIVEPGRQMVGNAGVIDTEIVLVSRKSKKDARRWVYLDIGKFGGLAETMDEAIQYPIVSAKKGGKVERVVLAGPTCDSADVMYEKADYRLPIDLEAGDRLEIRATGAYTTTYSAVAFNGLEPLKTYCI